MGALLPMLALPEAVANDTMPPRRAHLTIGAIHAGNGAGSAAACCSARWSACIRAPGTCSSTRARS
jgi:hypothetical protein